MIFFAILYCFRDIRKVIQKFSIEGKYCKDISKLDRISCTTVQLEITKSIKSKILIVRTKKDYIDIIVYVTCKASGFVNTCGNIAKLFNIDTSGEVGKKPIQFWIK